MANKFHLWLMSSGAVLTATPSLAQNAVEPIKAAVVASAQQESAAGREFEIIVTARRRAEDIATVPISITAVSGDVLQAKNITNLADITKLTPGLTISFVTSGRAQPFVVIRGQSRSVTGNVSPGVITYLNDVPLPNNGSIVQTFDMADVQILKGPQGTLFGRNSIGGAILTNTKPPTYDFGGYARTEVAQYNTYGFEGAINLPIVQDRVAIRFAGQVRKDGSAVNGSVFNHYSLASNGAGGIIATPGTEILNPRLRPGEYESNTYRASLLIEPYDWIKNITVGTYSKVRGIPAPLLQQLFTNGLNNDGNKSLYYFSPEVITGALTPAFGAAGAALYASIVQQLAQCPGGGVNCNVFAAEAAYEPNAIRDGISAVTRDPGLSRTIVKNISNTTVLKLGDNHQIKNIFAVTEIDGFSNSSLSGIPIPIFVASGTNTLTRQITDELQLSGSMLGDSLKYTVGGFYFKDRPDGPGGFGSIEQNAFFGLSHLITGNYLHNKSKAVYGQFDFSPKFVPGVTVTAGLRQTWDKQSTCATTQTFSPFRLGSAMVVNKAGDLGAAIPSEEACLANSGRAANAVDNTLPAGVTSRFFPEVSFKKLTYTFGINWQISRDAMVYATRRRGYRAGGYNVPLLDPYLASVQTFKPETLTDLEVGAKLKWNSGGMRGAVNIALFTGKDKGNQLPVSTSNLAAGICVPGAVGTAGRAANCTTGASQTAFAPGTPGIRIATTANTVTNNAADLTIRGIEVDAMLSPVEWLTLSGGAGYVDIKVDKLSLDPALAGFLRAAGRPLPTNVVIQGQPTWTVNGTVALEYPGEVLGGRLSAALDYKYNGSFRQIELDVPSTEFFDLSVSLDDIGRSGFSVSAWVKNLTDATLYPGTSASSPSALGFSTFLYGMARTFGVTGTYRFGAE